MPKAASKSRAAWPAWPTASDGWHALGVARLPAEVVLSGALVLVACSGAPSGSASSGGAAGNSGSSAVGGAAAGSSGAPSTAAGSGGVAGGAGSTAGGGAGGVTGGAGGMAAAGGAVGSNQFTGTAQLMVLGSSNELQTCWRALLWQTLQAEGIMDFDFVGDVSEGPDCGVPGYDKDLRAQSGIIVSNLTAPQFAGWFSAHPPDALLVHFGGADLLQNMPIAGVIQGYTLALEQARLVNPKVRILMGQHTPQTSPSCNDCEHTVPQLNDEIETWAAQHTQVDSPVVVIDLETGLDPAVDTDDGIHLNMVGSAKVAERFYAGLRPFFGP